MAIAAFPDGTAIDVPRCVTLQFLPSNLLEETFEEFAEVIYDILKKTFSLRRGDVVRMARFADLDPQLKEFGTKCLIMFATRILKHRAIAERSKLEVPFRLEAISALPEGQFKVENVKPQQVDEQEQSRPEVPEAMTEIPKLASAALDLKAVVVQEIVETAPDGSAVVPEKRTAVSEMVDSGPSIVVPEMVTVSGSDEVETVALVTVPSETSAVASAAEAVDSEKTIPDVPAVVGVPATATATPEGTAVISVPALKETGILLEPALAVTEEVEDGKLLEAGENAVFIDEIAEEETMSVEGATDYVRLLDGDLSEMLGVDLDDECIMYDKILLAKSADGNKTVEGVESKNNETEQTNATREERAASVEIVTTDDDQDSPPKQGGGFHKESYTTLPIDWNGAPAFQWRIVNDPTDRRTVVIENLMPSDLRDPWLYTSFLRARHVTLQLSRLADQEANVPVGELELQFSDAQAICSYALNLLVHVRTPNTRRLKIYLPQTRVTMSMKKDLEDRLGRVREAGEPMAQLVLKPLPATVGETTIRESAFKNYTVNRIEIKEDVLNQRCAIVTFTSAEMAIAAHSANDFVYFESAVGKKKQSVRVYYAFAMMRGWGFGGSESLLTSPEAKIYQSKKKAQAAAEAAEKLKKDSAASVTKPADTSAKSRPTTPVNSKAEGPANWRSFGPLNSKTTASTEKPKPTNGSTTSKPNVSLPTKTVVSLPTKTVYPTKLNFNSSASWHKEAPLGGSSYQKRPLLTNAGSDTGGSGPKFPRRSLLGMPSPRGLSSTAIGPRGPSSTAPGVYLPLLDNRDGILTRPMVSGSTPLKARERGKFPQRVFRPDDRRGSFGGSRSSDDESDDAEAFHSRRRESPRRSRRHHGHSSPDFVPSFSSSSSSSRPMAGIVAGGGGSTQWGSSPSRGYDNDRHSNQWAADIAGGPSRFASSDGAAPRSQARPLLETPSHHEQSYGDNRYPIIPPPVVQPRTTTMITDPEALLESRILMRLERMQYESRERASYQRPSAPESTREQLHVPQRGLLSSATSQPTTPQALLRSTSAALSTMAGYSGGRDRQPESLFFPRDPPKSYSSRPTQPLNLLSSSFESRSYSWR